MLYHTAKTLDQESSIDLNQLLTAFIMTVSSKALFCNQIKSFTGIYFSTVIASIRLLIIAML